MAAALFESVETDVSCAAWEGLKFEAKGGLGIQGLIPCPFFSTIVLYKQKLFSQGVWWFSRKKDPWKELGDNP